MMSRIEVKRNGESVACERLSLEDVEQLHVIPIEFESPRYFIRRNGRLIIVTQFRWRAREVFNRELTQLENKHEACHNQMTVKSK